MDRPERQPCARRETKGDAIRASHVKRGPRPTDERMTGQEPPSLNARSRLIRLPKKRGEPRRRVLQSGPDIFSRGIICLIGNRHTIVINSTPEQHFEGEND